MTDRSRALRVPWERAVLRRVPEWPDVEAMHCTNSTGTTRLVHAGYNLTVITAGRTEYRYRGKGYELCAGRVTLLEPGEVYASFAQHGVGEGHGLQVGVDRLRVHAAQLGVRGTLRLRPAPVASPTLCMDLLRLHDSLRPGASRLSRDSLLCAVIARLIALQSENKLAPPRHGPHPRVLRAREYLHAHAEVDVSLDELAAHAGCDKFYLLRTFRRACGLPPHAYQLALRVGRARQWLAQGRTARETAVALGFCDAQHLDRHFVRALGLTAAAYRRGGDRARGIGVEY